MKIMILLLVVVSFFWERMIPKTASHPFKNIRTSKYLNIEKEQWKRLIVAYKTPPPTLMIKSIFVSSFWLVLHPTEPHHLTN
jgi:hypothetical protein